jgi:HEPN domain-containing protein
MDNKTVALEWQRYAAQDLASAEFLLAMKPQPLEIICYHCQQCAEKHLKSFMAYQGVNITKTHDLISLNKTCREHDPSFSVIGDDCLELTDYGVQVRYPFQLELSETDVSLAIQSARRIADFVSAKVSQP